MSALLKCMVILFSKFPKFLVNVHIAEIRQLSSRCRGTGLKTSYMTLKLQEGHLVIDLLIIMHFLHIFAQANLHCKKKNKYTRRNELFYKKVFARYFVLIYFSRMIYDHYDLNEGPTKNRPNDRPNHRDTKGQVMIWKIY